MNAHTYSRDFYKYIDAGSSVSARTVCRLLGSSMSIGSLLDVGGGHGAWAREWLAAGILDIVCLDGDYINAEQLVIPVEMFQSCDLSRPFYLQKKFDLVQSLEVAEHVPQSSADIFIDNLVNHGDVILFSAAVPNQGGEHHINEQPPQYWRRKFQDRGYAAFDAMRPLLARHPEVKPWYRFNSFIYANESGAERLSAGMQQTRVAESVDLNIGGDLGWTLRRAAVGFIPNVLVKPIAMLKATAETRLKTPWSQPAAS